MMEYLPHQRMMGRYFIHLVNRIMNKAPANPLRQRKMKVYVLIWSEWTLWSCGAKKQRNRASAMMMSGIYLSVLLDFIIGVWRKQTQPNAKNGMQSIAKSMKKGKLMPQLWSSRAIVPDKNDRMQIARDVCCLKSLSEIKWMKQNRMLISKRQSRNQMGMLKKYSFSQSLMMSCIGPTGLEQMTCMSSRLYKYTMTTENSKNQKTNGISSLLVFCLRKSKNPL